MMKEKTQKMLFIITIALAILFIIFKVVINSEYYRIVKSINNRYEQQNIVDYKDSVSDKE